MNKYLASFALSFLCTMVFADGIKVTGSVPFTLPSVRATNALAAGAPKKTLFMKLSVSAQVHQLLLNRLPQLKLVQNPQTLLPSSTLLGMNGVPPLDQGMHNTCVTFAVSEAIDAALGKGDYVSQLCFLQLGTSLAKNSYTSSGWDGAHGSRILNRFSEFGIVNKAYQEKFGCGGQKEYQLFDDIEAPMPLAEYHQASEDIENNKIHWAPIFNLFEDELSTLADRRDDVQKNIVGIKTALANKERVVLGFFLHLPFDHPENAEKDYASYHKKNDTLILSQGAIDDLKAGSENFGGHEILLTGYDDKAVAYDNDGKPHVGLFYYRNSVADLDNNYDMYISYDYVKLFADEAYGISVNPSLPNTN